MSKIISPELIKISLLQINAWHVNIPLMFVFSKQRPGPNGEVGGGAQAVKDAYDELFNLKQIGIEDNSREFYLHLCHGTAKAYPYALRKPTDNYGKTHQRIIKDTFGQAFLQRFDTGKYRLTTDFVVKALAYYDLSERLDLKPLVLFHYWTSVRESKTVGDLWQRFTSEFAVDIDPFDSLFTCTDLGEELILFEEHDVDMSLLKQMVLPDEYGVGGFSTDFWKRFNQILEDRFRALNWQGTTHGLSSSITSALMYDQALFLLGPPGTGKSTIVSEAILPALRKAYGEKNQLKFSLYSLTPHTSEADLFGFQGLDGQWIMGPLAKDILLPYLAEGEEIDQIDAGVAVPRLVFLDEANRVDVEGLMSPIQAGLDQLQKRQEPSVIHLGSSKFQLPNRIFRIFAGNSPAADIGRREQSRPFKRRVTTVIPPDPLTDALRSDASFRAVVLSLLERAAKSTDVEIKDPAIGLLGVYRTNSGRLDDLRILLIEIRSLPRVAVSVGLLESILLRTATHRAIGSDDYLDVALYDSLLTLITGDRQVIEALVELTNQKGFARLSKGIKELVLSANSNTSNDIDAIM